MSLLPDLSWPIFLISTAQISGHLEAASCSPLPLPSDRIFPVLCLSLPGFEPSPIQSLCPALGTAPSPSPPPFSSSALSAFQVRRNMQPDSASQNTQAADVTLVLP